MIRCPATSRCLSFYALMVGAALLIYLFSRDARPETRSGCQPGFKCPGRCRAIAAWRVGSRRALALVAGHGGGAFEFGLGLVEPAELGERRSALDARQQVVVLQRRLVEQLVDEIEAGLRPERHRQRDRAVELDDRARG